VTFSTFHLPRNLHHTVDLKDLMREEAGMGAAASAAQAKKLKSMLAAQHIANAERVGTGGEILNDRFKASGLKSDPSHRVASYLTEEELAKGRVFPISGYDGVRRTLVQILRGISMVGRESSSTSLIMMGRSLTRDLSMEV
jgi:hypothetical protein